MQNKIILIVAVIAIVVGVWYGLSQSGPPVPLLTTTTPGGAAATQSTDQEIIGTLLALRAVTLSGTIFSDPSFTTLQDYGTKIIPEPIGRPNPFAPLGAQNRVPTSTSTPRATQIFTPAR